MNVACLSAFCLSISFRVMSEVHLSFGFFQKPSFSSAIVVCTLFIFSHFSSTLSESFASKPRLRICSIMIYRNLCGLFDPAACLCHTVSSDLAVSSFGNVVWSVCWWPWGCDPTRRLVLSTHARLTGLCPTFWWSRNGQSGFVLNHLEMSLCTCAQFYVRRLIHQQQGHYFSVKCTRNVLFSLIWPSPCSPRTSGQYLWSPPTLAFRSPTTRRTPCLGMSLMAVCKVLYKLSLTSASLVGAQHTMIESLVCGVANCTNKILSFIGVHLNIVWYAAGDIMSPTPAQWWLSSPLYNSTYPSSSVSWPTPFQHILLNARMSIWYCIFSLRTC